MIPEYVSHFTLSARPHTGKSRQWSVLIPALACPKISLLGPLSVSPTPYELYLELNDIEHTKTKAKSPQTNGICERVHQTILNEFYRVTFRKKVYSDLETLQKDLSEYMNEYNYKRTRQGQRCQGRTPMETFLESKKHFTEKHLSESLAA